MSSARKCDICHNYYDVPDVEVGTLEPWNNTSMVRVLRLNPDAKKEHIASHDVIHFDACEKCLQDVLDYILTKSAETSSGGN